MQALGPGAKREAVEAHRRSRLGSLTWALLAYLLAVILFGAWVRITGSGAGCGSHWPTCHGEIVPRSPAADTVIEYTHRVTSGLLGFAALALVAWCFLGRAPRPARIASVITLGFVVLEALIGAGIVLAELVGSDDSGARAAVIAIHLVSTFSLTAATGLTAWWASGHAAPRWRDAPGIRWPLLGAVGAVLIVSMTGAITALGDTLFPVAPTDGDLLGRLRDDLSPAAHFLVRLRIVHPILAVLATAGLIALPGYVIAPSDRAQRLLLGIRIAAVCQLGLGPLNIALGAPGWLQLGHLLAAQVLWLLLVLALAEALGASARGPERGERPRATRGVTAAP